jgi:hypothetical protein
MSSAPEEINKCTAVSKSLMAMPYAGKLLRDTRRTDEDAECHEGENEKKKETRTGNTIASRVEKVEVRNLRCY